MPPGTTKLPDESSKKISFAERAVASSPSGVDCAWNSAPRMRPFAIVQRLAWNSISPFSISPSSVPANST